MMICMMDKAFSLFLREVLLESYTMKYGKSASKNTNVDKKQLIEQI